MEKSPDAFRTISEAAEELDLPQHVLRFWETRFSTIKPLKRGGGRRYYRPEDVLLLKGIRHLLYDQGFTIKGVQRILKDQGPRYVIAVAEGTPVDALVPLREDEGDEVAPFDGEEPLASTVAPAPVLSAPHLVRAAAPTPPVGAPNAAPKRGLDEADKEKLAAVLKELLDCKRLLERARET